MDLRFNHTRFRKRSPLNTKSGAKEYEAFLRQKLARGEDIDGEEKQKKEPEQLFSSFAWRWFEVYVKNNNKHSEIIGKESVLRFHLVPFFGNTPLGKIKSLDIEEYKSRKTNDKLSGKTINNHLAVLRKCLNTAQEWSLIENVPTIRFLKVQSFKVDYLSEEECELLLNKTKGVIVEMILLALRTGLRFGELIALNWQDVNLDRKILTVDKSISKGLMGSTKSNKARYIPLSSDLTMALGAGINKSGFIFNNGNGQAMKQVPCCKALHRACRQAGVREIGWHLLRHTFASHLAQRGISLKAIQELLGHRDIRTTMRYAHLSPSELRSAIDVLDPGKKFGQPVGNQIDFGIKFSSYAKKERENYG